NLGIAVDTDRGLLVPTVFGAEKMSLNQLAGESKEVINATKAGSVSPDKLKGASFTVTNLGSFGIESFTPVINPPQTAILGVDCVTYRVKADGSAYPAMGLSLTFDHRALDGAPAARFLKALCDNLANFNILLAK
ncbi:MAG: 2-oxo acid dehydrogenase subunit E2, partial [Clostridia bacterium]|nr:2-oxo acid dehydrogenase subunit E2 [Clostridia bacterium]